MTITDTDIVQLDTRSNKREVTVQSVKELLFAGKGRDETPTNAEIELFIEMCKHHKLNPFIGEVFLRKYRDSRAQIILGKGTFTKRARRLKASWDAGVIIMRNGEAIHDYGSMVYDGSTLIGGWAVVRTHDGATFRSKVSLAEYSSGQATWRSLPATMIRKVALVQALREAYPDAFEGLYDSSEMAQATPDDVDLVAETGGTGEEPETDSVPWQSKPETISLSPTMGVSDTPEAAAPARSQAPYCEKHDVEFAERTNSKTGERFYSHQIQGGGWCHPPREAPETHRRAARSNAGPPSDLIDQETAMQAEMDARSGDNMEPPIASMGEEPSSEVSW